ncbi:MAG: hypothetical protein H6641_23485 [Caldilineaceae bacterium]|nr:hypothetical protein [Caldilineaceae bacterium]
MKQLFLIVLAISVVTICGISGLQNRGPRLLAQDSPLPTETLTPTPSLTPTITNTPLPTPTKGNITEIEEPRSGGVMAGFFPIRGTALNNSYLKYDLHIAAAGSEDWHWLVTSFNVVRGGPLYILDTTEYPDGYYDLRVRAIQQDGNYTEAYARNVEIRNANPPTPTPVINVLGTMLPPSPLSPLFTPTPTPIDIHMRIPDGQGFYGPEEGAVISSFAPIAATVNDLGQQVFKRYDLAISTAGLDEWSHLVSSERQYWRDTIYVLNTTQWPDGYYDLRLRVVYVDGNYSEYYLRNLRIANQHQGGGANQPVNGIQLPHDGETAVGMLDLFGTAVDPQFLRWELYWSPSGTDSWTFLVEDDHQLVGGMIAWLDLSQLAAGRYDFRFRIVRQDFNYTDYYVRNLQVIPPEPTPTRTPTPTRVS